MKKFEVTDFAKSRVWNHELAGTTINDVTSSEYETLLNSDKIDIYHILDGYSDFCKLFVYRNFTDANAGTIEINEENKFFVRSEYKARTEKELPVLTRWMECEEPPRAEYLVNVCYSAGQMEKEGTPISAEWGIVAVLGQMHPNEEPMPPITMMRNALGVEEGGSGKELDREEYLRSVIFWDKHAVVKQH